MDKRVEVKTSMTLPLDEIVALVKKRIPIDRYDALTEKYGECCSKDTAAKLISVSIQTIARMVRDGRLRTTSDGQRIDVRSIVDYIEGKHGVQTSRA